MKKILPAATTGILIFAVLSILDHFKLFQGSLIRDGIVGALSASASYLLFSIVSRKSTDA